MLSVPGVFPPEIHQTYLTVLKGENASDGPVWLKHAYKGCSDAAQQDRVIPLEQAAHRNRVASLLVGFKAAGVLPIDVCPSFETHNATIDERYVPYRAPDAIATCSLDDFAIHIHRHRNQTAAQAKGESEPSFFLLAIHLYLLITLHPLCVDRARGLPTPIRSDGSSRDPHGRRHCMGKCVKRSQTSFIHFHIIPLPCP